MVLKLENSPIDIIYFSLFIILYNYNVITSI